MYAHVGTTGTLAFRLDHCLNGRREIVLLSKCQHSDISLGVAREKLLDAKRVVLKGQSLAQERQHQMH